MINFLFFKSSIKMKKTNIIDKIALTAFDIGMEIRLDIRENDVIYPIVGQRRNGISYNR